MPSGHLSTHLSAVEGCGEVAEVAWHAIQLEKQLQPLRTTTPCRPIITR